MSTLRALPAILYSVAAIVTAPATGWAHGGGASDTLQPWTNWPFVPELLIGVVIAASFYVTGWLRRRDRTGTVSGWRHGSFFAGLVALLIALQSPLDVLAVGRKSHGMTLPIEFIAHCGEEIPLDIGSVDTVVTTWALCTIPDPLRVLEEMRRVLKTGGVMLFAEHGLAPEAQVQGWA